MKPVVAEHLSPLMTGQVTRYELPGIHAFNFVCEQALGGGGMASLRNDSLGKGMGQILLAMRVRVPQQWGLTHEVTFTVAELETRAERCDRDG